MNEDGRKLVLIDQDKVDLDGSDTSNNDPKINSPFDPDKIRVDTKNMQMDALIKRIAQKEIDLAPDFQRQAEVWNLKTQSRLIESMLIKIPLPAFYMDASDDDKWLIVDGLQRLTTIDKFVIKKNMLLEGLEFLTEYNGKGYDQLPRGFQRRIEETDVVVYQIQPGTPDQVKFDIFKRINTGGAPLKAQEIRHALNQGQITEFLKTLSESSEFKTATAYGVSAKRMDDRECVLRFIAFSMHPAKKYNDDNFDQFLNKAMVEANEMSESELAEYRQKFENAMKGATNIFGDDAFRKRYAESDARHPINKALFEAWSVNLGLLTQDDLTKISKQKKSLINRFMEIMKDSEFNAAISQGTGSVKRVSLRFGKIGEIIQEELLC